MKPFFGYTETALDPTVNKHDAVLRLSTNAKHFKVKISFTPQETPSTCFGQEVSRY